MEGYAETRTDKLYSEARAAVMNDDRILPGDKEKLLYLPPLYLITWCEMAGMIRKECDD